MKQILKYFNKLQILSESSTLIVVDVQPGHKSHITFDLQDFTEYLNDYDGVIYYVFHGVDLGYEDVDALQEWLLDNGVNEDKLNHINFIEKSYGWLRDAIDSYDVDNTETVEILKYMMENDIQDSRDIGDEDKFKENFPNLSDATCEHFGNESTSIYLSDIIDDLKYINSTGIIIGGGKDECLLEVELTLEALGKKYSRYNKFIY